MKGSLRREIGDRCRRGVVLCIYRYIQLVMSIFCIFLPCFVRLRRGGGIEGRVVSFVIDSLLKRV